MSDLETDFTQAGSLNDPSLGRLRDEIKRVMIPLLIKTFQCKQELSQSLSIPSRLQNKKNQRPPEEILQQLRNLDEDLKVLLLWCQSCRSQIHKALNTEEEQKKNIAPTESAAVSTTKSVKDAVSRQKPWWKKLLKD